MGKDTALEDQSSLRWGVLAAAVVGGILLIGFALASSGDLTGRTWVVEEFVIEGTATAPVPDTVVTAVFDNESVAGISGCNNYFAGYETDGDQIEFGLAGSTRMFCSEPPGVMEQELAYLGLLSTADSFDVDRDTLTLYADGEAIMVFAEASSS